MKILIICCLLTILSLFFTAPGTPSIGLQRDPVTQLEEIMKEIQRLNTNIEKYLANNKKDVK